MKLEIKKIGNSTGLILPKELLTRLNLGQGDWLYVTEMADGGLRLGVADPDFQEAIDIARKGTKRYASALRELAK